MYLRWHDYCLLYETIYNCVYLQLVSELLRDLITCLPKAHYMRVSRSKWMDQLWQIPDTLSIHLCLPAEIEDRQFPGHWEGNLIKGEADTSAVCTQIECSSRLLMPVKLPHPKPTSAANVVQAFQEKLNRIDQPMRFGMTCSQSRQMSVHARLREQTGTAMYFCDLHSPWQIDIKKNMNSLVCQNLPKGTGMSGYSPKQFDAITNDISDLPRKGLARFSLRNHRELLLNGSHFSTLIH